MNTKNSDFVDAAAEQSSHTFHIPVMGTGFSIDTPLKVAKYGISSVISLVDDVLIEQMRKFHCQKNGEPYQEITKNDQDVRAKRITAYLNLVDKLVARQVKELQSSPFEKGSEITKYYEMLPDSPLKELYTQMLNTKDLSEKTSLQEELRKKAVPGSIDVNIMTKLDAAKYHDGQKLPHEFSDAMTALRGYAQSTLQSAIVFSAGINQQLYSYMTQFKDFFWDTKNSIKKKIVLKVSDYRSALTQGKFLAKKGLWVSEYRIESGLNCGGHAFASKGYLMGPILEEFKKQKNELVTMLHSAYSKACESLNIACGNQPHEISVSVQGGIGTYEEDSFLRNFYKVDRTGWGTPFMLAPDVVNIDQNSLKILADADENTSYLSESSPMNVPFWNLRNSPSEEARHQRIAEGHPGTTCPKGYIMFNSEFTERPVCVSSKTYQKFKLKALKESNLPENKKSAMMETVQAKSCICHDLAASATLTHGIDMGATPALCCGPNIAFFSKITNLEEMVNHIYGRLSVPLRQGRPHMFTQELKIYFEHLISETEKLKLDLSIHTPKYLTEFKENLLEAIHYYKQIASNFVDEQRERFIADLEMVQQKLESIPPIIADHKSAATLEDSAL